MGVPVQRNNSGSTSALSELKRIQKIVNDTVRSYLGGGQNASQMREKQVRCFRTVAHDTTGSGAPTYPLYPANVFAGVMGRPFFKQEPGLQSLEFKPYAGPVVRYLMDPFNNYRVEGEVVFCQLIHGQWFILGGNHEFLFRARVTGDLPEAVVTSGDSGAPSSNYNFTDVRRLPDHAPIPCSKEDSTIIGGVKGDGREVRLSNSKNHSAALDSVVYLVKSYVRDEPVETGTATTVENPFRVTGTGTDVESGPDKHFYNPLGNPVRYSTIYLDIIDVPLRSIMSVNHIQTLFFDVSSKTPVTKDYAQQNSVGTGVVQYTSQCIKTEWIDNHVNVCPILTFGPCNVTIDIEDLYETGLESEGSYIGFTIGKDQIDGDTYPPNYDYPNAFDSLYRECTDMIWNGNNQTGTSTSS